MTQPPVPPGQPPRPPVPPPRRTYPKAETLSDQPVGAALFGGAVAALVGAGLWTLLVKLTEREIGWVAWGVGALVGLVMSKMTEARGATLGVYAALLAALGLATGKVMTIKVVLAPMAQEEFVDDPEMLTQAFVWDMRERETYSPEINQQLLRLGDDTVPDLLWSHMVTEATARRDAAPQPEKERVVKAFVTEMFQATGFTQQLMSTLSLFDLLWFFLAIGTAWKIMRGG